MIHPFVLMLLCSCLAAGALGAAILARDPEQRANRLIAAILGCSSFWSLCEVVWNLSDDPDHVVRIIRISSLGWVMLGPLALDLFGEVTIERRTRFRRIVPLAYAAAAVAICLYILTPWCIASAIRVSWGWSYEFGFLFPVAFVPTIMFVASVLVMWPRFFSADVSPGEGRQSLWMFFGILIPATAASLTDVLMPSLGFSFPRLGSTSILVVGAIVARSMRRYGYFLLAPAAFTEEILESLRDGIVLLREDGRIRFCNEAFARLAGQGRSSLRDRAVAELLPEFELEAAAMSTEADSLLVSTSDGEIPVAVSSSTLRDDKGNAIGCVLAIRDLRQVVALRNRLVTAGRLAAVGELAAGIAHEIGNPISYVRSNIVQLRHSWALLGCASDKLDPHGELDAIFREGEEILDESVEGIDRVTSIVRDVGAISHAGIGSSELADVTELLENALNVAALSFSVTVERCYSETPRVRCAPQQLKQVFLDLLLNAIQAIGDYGNIRLVTASTHGAVEVRIEDDGCGIPEEHIDRIFDPFFTTQPAGKGTGLGLALCYQIVRQHGGEISVRSRVGVGTSVLVQLPAATEGSRASA